MSEGGFSTREQQQIEKKFMAMRHRGPDFSCFDRVDDRAIVGFHRLSIMDVSAKGHQPFILEKDDGKKIYLICNGEIYNYRSIVAKYDLQVRSGSDCEVILLLYDMFCIAKVLDELLGEFAFVIYDQVENKVFSGRDPVGVRPLFLGTSQEKGFGLSSELKGLAGLYDDIIQFHPGRYMIYDCESQSMDREMYHRFDVSPICDAKTDVYADISTLFSLSVKERLSSDRPIGCLLSGGLDSSICAALAMQYSSVPIQTFTIGLEGATDIPFAEMVAQHIGSDHTTFLVTEDEAIAYLDETILAIESFDITSVRASVWQYILAKKISETTDTKVLICGELSDELMSGYKYFHKAPDPMSMHQENIRLVQDVCFYDGLRTDRTMAAHGLEVRLPFADVRFVDYFLRLDPKDRMPHDGIEKYLFRQAFSTTGLLPDAVLRRSKEALSDGTSSQKKSWFQILQDHIDGLVSDEEFYANKDSFAHCPPQTKEAYYYRKKFVSYFGDMYSTVIPYFRLPKRCGDVINPSARVLKDVYK